MKTFNDDRELESSQEALGLENPRRPYVTGTCFRIHARSERQLPTEIDCVGEPKGRSTNIRMINRRFGFLGCFLVLYDLEESQKGKRKHLTGHSISGAGFLFPDELPIF